MSRKNYFTPREVARLFKVSPVTVRQWAQKGLLEAVFTAGGHRRFELRELARFAQERGIQLDWRNGGNIRLLIIDNDRPTTDSLLGSLQDLPCIEAMGVAESGFDAGFYIHSFRPTTVLIDLVMPGIDSFGICRQLKSDPLTRHIRLLAMAAFSNRHLTRRLLAAGGEVCLEKPVNIEVLLQRLACDRDQAPQTTAADAATA